MDSSFSVAYYISEGAGSMAYRYPVYGKRYLLVRNGRSHLEGWLNWQKRKFAKLESETAHRVGTCALRHFGGVTLKAREKS